MIKRVNLIGAGNVGHFLARQFVDKIEIASVYSRTLEAAQAITSSFSGNAINELSEIDLNVDLNIVCLKDDAVNGALIKLPKPIPIVHTSGILKLDVLESFDNFGTLYPLQTISKDRVNQLSDVPVFYEANNSVFEQELETFIKQNISLKAKKMNSKTKEKVHLAAVFANNFTNHMLTISSEILSEKGEDLALFRELLQETINKAFEQNPKAVQTGPAKRKDTLTMQRHLDLLKDDDLKEIYSLISKDIQRRSTS